jgi:diketogulonate reductase-like aldo/keto reductase
MDDVKTTLTSPVVECNGARIPVAGLGTWALRGATAKQMVQDALALGIRHIDTARMYDNERDVGAGIRASGVPRSEVFLTTKLLPIVTNQVEFHPYLDQTKMLAACRRHGMSLTAYSPLAQGAVAHDPAIQEIAARHGKTAGQVALRWLVQH